MSSAIAMTECVLLHIHKRAMMKTMGLQPKLSAVFLKYLLRRNIRYQDDLVDQLFNSSEKRLARVLLLMAQFGKEGVSEMSVPRLRQETLAEMVGTTRSRVSFFMREPNKRVAVLSPIAWRTPPRQYGAWETVASNITEGLVARGWDVTLFASGDSATRAHLHSVVDKGYEEDSTVDPKVAEYLHISEAFEHAGEFDLIHSHCDFMVNSSIGNSGQLITRTLLRHKHQLRDFFNRHA